MKEFGLKNPSANLSELGLENVATAWWNLSAAELVEKSLENNQGTLTETGALAVDTGEFTGRSPKDRFIVKDSVTENTVNWGEVNIPFSEENFDRLLQKMTAFLAGKEVFVRDAYACSDPQYRLNIRVITQLPWQNLFANNLFLRPTAEEIKTIQPDWTVIAAPEFCAIPEEDGTRQHNFAILNFSRKMIIIGGTAYTGEIKKGIFSVLNYILPKEHGVLSMHCSANVGDDGDTAIFFGLSGTGKTTLSADPSRGLIGDDEHGWADNTVFNFEGGCYAKCINLNPVTEPQIFSAIRFGSLLENTRYFSETRKVNYEDATVTENTRVAYPIDFIDNAISPSIGTTPKNIFFLTCDAFGVLPPISRLTKGQAMFHFISGYTAKVAGTEAGITEPKTTFSACFGSPFLPLHPTEYAEMLGEKMNRNNVRIWLINTGWTGGPYGIGKRMKLPYTREMISAALRGDLDNVSFVSHPVFGVEVPLTCPGVPDEVLDPRNTWEDKNAYDQKANELAEAFNQNFKKYADRASVEILEAAPKIAAKV